VTFPGDKQYVYAFLPDKNVTEQTTSGIGTWFAKNTKTGKIFNISKYYPQTEKKLDTMYPEAKNLVDKSPKDLNTTTTPPPTGVEDIQGKNWKYNQLENLICHLKIFLFLKILKHLQRKKVF